MPASAATKTREPASPIEILPSVQVKSGEGGRDGLGGKGFEPEERDSHRVYSVEEMGDTEDGAFFDGFFKGVLQRAKR